MFTQLGSRGLCSRFSITLLTPAPGQKLGCSTKEPLLVVAGNNKPGPNFIEIGSANRDGWSSEVKIIRTTSDNPSPSQSSKGGKRSAPVKNLVQADVTPEQQEPIVEATKRGRGGKTVTVIKRLQLTDETLQSLCKNLKNKIGAGGAVKDATIEIQGDHSAKIVEALIELGYKAKKSGR
ncbi:hypothetical protein R1flu_011461 [Riccia fluitans]|uniref:SUI1 domain-containing protein n=1 Tax=Riccia fluitans TaxID=41844 RepID=A0ABD1Z7W0_9MARC